MSFSDPIRLINLGPMNWLRTQSVARSTAALMGESALDTVIMAIPVHPYLTVGGGTLPEAVVDISRCVAANVPVITTPLNSPLTFAGTQSMLFQWVFRDQDAGVLALQMAKGVITGLESLGLADLNVNSQSIRFKDTPLATIAHGVMDQIAVVQGCLHMNLDRNLLQSLALEIRETALWRVLPRPMPPDAVQEALLSGFEEALGRPIKRGTPEQAETRLSKQIDLELLEQAAHILGTQIVFGAQ